MSSKGQHIVDIYVSTKYSFYEIEAKKACVLFTVNLCGFYSILKWE
jgi:hypothetical protein